jgi:hypothetical protein
MAGRSSYEWRTARGAVNRGLERLEDTPWNLLHGRGLVTDSAKRKLYEQGTIGRAEILERPPDRTMVGGQAEGVFRLIVHLPGREPYDVKSRQSYSGFEWDLLAEGTSVECRVSSGNEKRVLLCAPEPDEVAASTPAQVERIESSADLLATGRRAVATVSESSPLGQRAPGTDDEFFLRAAGSTAEGLEPKQRPLLAVAQRRSVSQSVGSPRPRREGAALTQRRLRALRLQRERPAIRCTCRVATGRPAKRCLRRATRYPRRARLGPSVTASSVSGAAP